MGDIAAEDEETLDRIRRICLAFGDVEEAELQDRALFRVGHRRFAIYNGAASPSRRRWAGSGRSLHFLTEPGELAPLLHDPRFDRSPHHGDRGWLMTRLDRADVDWREIAEILDAAHAQVSRLHR